MPCSIPRSFPALINLPHLMVFILFSAFLFAHATNDISNQTESFQEPFQLGKKLYSLQKYEAAKANFVTALKANTNNPYILYNLGLTHFKLGETGHSLGYLRKALYISPYFKNARVALNTVIQSSGNNLSWQSSFFWDTIRLYFLNYFTAETLWLVTSIIFLGAGHQAIRYLGKYSQAPTDESQALLFTKYSATFYVLLPIFFLLSMAKTYEYYHPRATIVVHQLSVNVGPHKEDNSLFELTEGFEVQIDKLYKNWVQITSQGGQTGWVPRNTLFHTTGFQPW